MNRRGEWTYATHPQTDAGTRSHTGAE